MDVTITLDVGAVRALEKIRQQAIAHGLPLEQYLADLAESRERPSAYRPMELTMDQFRQWLIDLSAGMPPLPPIPSDFSRDDIYNDHD